jgi:hypothetical protein
MRENLYTDELKVRCRPELVERVGRAAAAQFMRPSEYIRRAVVDRLQSDGMLLKADLAPEVS